MKGLCDSDSGQDKETRKSITGFIIYLNEVAISWRSKAQGAVALSSTEAEYYALSEAMAEIKFIAQLLEFLDIEIKFPIIVHIDNIGAIYLSRNATSGNRTKHIDTCIHFVWEYQEEGKVLVKFIRSEDNDSDIMTKNVSGELYIKHSEKLICKKEDI